MRLVHFADTHIGFRTFTRTTPSGINQRESDVAQSFNRTIDQTIALAPDLVVIGGDVFHASRPSNHAILHAYRGFKRLAAALPRTPIVMVSGNHDAPNTSEMGGILRLLAELGVHVVDGAPRVVDLPQLDCSVLAVPDNHHTRPVLTPTGTRRWNVLLMHGETGGISPKGSPAAEREISAEDMHADAWDYTALGHYHVYREVAPRCYYSGAVDYTTTNAWGEHAEEREKGLVGKGIVERDLSTGAQTFHSLPRTREWVDLEPISARDLSAGDLNDQIELAVEGIEGGITDKVVRLTVTDLSRTTGRQIDHRMIGRFRRRALDFRLNAERPEAIQVGGHSRVMVALRRRAGIDEMVETMLRDCALPADLDRAEFVALGRQYHAAAGEVKSVTILGRGASDEVLAHARSFANVPSPYDDGPIDPHLPAALSGQLSAFA